MSKTAMCASCETKPLAALARLFPLANGNHTGFEGLSGFLASLSISVTCVWLLVLLVPENLQSGKFYWPLRLLSPRLPFFLAINSRRHSVTFHNARTRFELQAVVLAGTNDAMMELAARAGNTGTPSNWQRAEWRCFMVLKPHHRACK